LSLFVAQARLRQFDLYERKGMVSSKNQGVQVSERRHKFRSIERIYLRGHVRGRELVMDDSCPVLVWIVRGLFEFNAARRSARMLVTIRK
jgi:hypothetical protein